MKRDKEGEKNWMMEMKTDRETENLDNGDERETETEKQTYKQTHQDTEKGDKTVSLIDRQTVADKRDHYRQADEQRLTETGT